MGLFYALAAAVVWGLNYSLFEKASEKVSVFSLMLVDAFILFLVSGVLLLFNKKTLIEDITTFGSDGKIVSFVLFTSIVTAIGYTLISLSIKDTNATIAGLIEISYPIFIIIWTFLLFREHNMNPSILIGGSFIFIGIGIIFYFNNQ